MKINLKGQPVQAIPTALGAQPWKKLSSKYTEREVRTEVKEEVSVNMAEEEGDGLASLLPLLCSHSLK